MKPHGRVPAGRWPSFDSERRPREGDDYIGPPTSGGATVRSSEKGATCPRPRSARGVQTMSRVAIAEPCHSAEGTERPRMHCGDVEAAVLYFHGSRQRLPAEHRGQRLCKIAVVKTPT